MKRFACSHDCHPLRVFEPRFEAVYPADLQKAVVYHFPQRRDVFAAGAQVRMHVFRSDAAAMKLTLTNSTN